MKIYVYVITIWIRKYLATSKGHVNLFVVKLPLNVKDSFHF